MTRSISFISTLRLIRSAAARGLEAPTMWNMVGGEPCEDAPRSIPATEHFALWAYVMRSLDDPSFPIEYARTRSIADFGVLGLASKTSDTIGEALAVIERYLPAYTDAMTVRLLRGGAPELVLEHSGAMDLGQRCSVESELAVLLTSMQQLVDGPLVPCAVTFAHGRPRAIDAHRAHFGVAPQFSATRNAIVFAPEVLRRRNVRTDPAFHCHLVSELANLLSARSGTWSERTRNEIQRRLPEPIEIATVARAIGTSNRTLQRRLCAEGMRFDEIADSVRYELSRALLADRSRTIAEVASACGFAEPSSFSRAYRRWTGAPPARHRSS